MPVKLSLKSGLIIQNADEMLKKKFEQWPWEKYDGDIPSDPFFISEHDIDRIYKLGIRCKKSVYTNFIKKEGQNISKFLHQLPTEEALEDLNLEDVRDSIVGIFNIFLKEKYIKMAGATKLLYPFRPKILPIIDAFVNNYYWYATSIQNELRFRKLKSFKVPNGEYLFELISIIKDDVVAAQTEIDMILESCIGQEYESISRIRVVESLIWKYYSD